MLKPKIIVTGATGKTGSVVVAELLKAGYPVRAMVRREDARSVRVRTQGAEIAVADMSRRAHRRRPEERSARVLLSSFSTRT
jgi:NAD(P)H dehydrogenase (quinone)